MELKEQKQKLLIVDDDPHALKLITKIFEKHDLEIITFESPIKALSKIEEILPDVIILDINMPLMSGIELTQKIRSIPKMRLTPIALISAYFENVYDIGIGLENGANDYIKKPFNTQELTVRVLSLLRQKRLYDEIENQNKRIDNIKKAMLQSICKLSEFRDNDTNKHIIRVQEYTRLIAEQLSKTIEYGSYITEKYIEDISIASMLHDIGKIGISDAILLKPAKLTDFEFESMKKHTTIGYHALEHIIEDADKESFITLAKVIAHTHHEKFDGTGYPQRLKGEEIPLSGRIVCIADVYDALTSERCYKKAIPHSQAIKHIEMEKYKFFDPFIVENFLDIEKQIEQVLINYQDNSLLAV